MKIITFRPLRRIKKTGKIVVASYPQWRKVKTADYSRFKLIVDTEYKTLPPDEYVFNHEGKNLFWRDYDPEQIPTLPYLDGYSFEPEDIVERKYPPQWKTDYNMYCAKGLDCSGVPAFSHGTEKEITIGNMHNYTLEEVGESLNTMNGYELLTVRVVVKWFGWFLYQLENNELQIGK